MSLKELSAQIIREMTRRAEMLARIHSCMLCMKSNSGSVDILDVFVKNILHDSGLFEKSMLRIPMLGSQLSIKDTLRIV